LTSKATALSDNQLKLAGFVPLSPRHALKDGEAKRQIWASREVYDLLKGLKNPEAGFPDIESDAFVTRFWKGYIVSASRREKSKAEFKWLKGHDDVWVLSFRKPPPGWRVFGRFARKNVFVAMVYYERECLLDMIVYNREAAKIPDLWNQKFPDVKPYQATHFEEYFGNMVRNDDE